MPKKMYGRVVMIHGAKFTKRARNNLRRLAPAFRSCGFCIVIPTYGYLPALLVGLFPWLDERIAEALSGFIEPSDILVGHSNGGTLSYLISQRVKVRGAVLINAALESHVVPNADFVHVYFNEGDVVAKLSAMLPFHIWGSMGGHGYTGLHQPHIKNIDQAHPPDDLPALWGHSDIFSVGKCRKWSRFMAEFVLQEVLLLNRRRHHV